MNIWWPNVYANICLPNTLSFPNENVLSRLSRECVEKHSEEGEYRKLRCVRKNVGN